MAWFGGNLKNLTENLTGQLSNVATSAASFTRDVIAEGTEEVAGECLFSLLYSQCSVTALLLLFSVLVWISQSWDNHI